MVITFNVKLNKIGGISRASLFITFRRGRREMGDRPAHPHFAQFMDITSTKYP